MTDETKPLLSVDPDLPFKGSRTYLHGTDLYPAAVDALGEVRDVSEARIKMFFRDFARHACRLDLTDGAAPTPRPEDTVAEVGAVWPDGGHILGRFVETARPVTRRVAYDEDAIGACTWIEGETISLDAEPNNTAIEIVVALTKRLHYHLFPLTDGRWIFSRLDIVRPLRPDDRRGLNIAVRHRLGESLTRSEITGPDGRIGDIFFSVGHP